jgi:hypothetical protein
VGTPTPSLFNGTPKGQIIQTMDGSYKVKPPQNVITMFGNPVKPVNINQNEFKAFDNYGFMNSQIKPVQVNI